MGLIVSQGKTYGNDYFLYVICIIIASLILMRDIGDLSFNKYILLALCTLPMCILSYSNVLCLLSFLFALTFGIPSNFIYGIAVVVLLVKRKKNDAASLLLATLFATWTILETFLYGASVSAASLSGFVFRLFLLFMLLRDDSSDVDYEKAISLFSIGVIVTCVAVLGYFLKANSIESMINFGIRLGDASSYLEEGAEQGMKMNTNANNIACYCICAMGCCLNIFIQKRNVLWAVLYFVVFILGMLTVSRAFIVLGTFMTIYFIHLSSRGNNPWYLKITLILIIIVGLYHFFNSDFISVFDKRFGNESISDDSRGFIFFGYWNAFWSDPLSILVGAGVYSHRDILFSFQACHNMLQQILVSYGVIGFIVYISFLWNSFKNELKLFDSRSTVKMLALCPIVFTLLFQQTIQYLAPHDLMLPTIIGMFALKNIRYKLLQLK